MRKLLISCIAVLVVNSAFALDKKPIGEVDTDALTIDLQAELMGTGDDHLALVWWIPREFWDATVTQDSTFGEAEKELVLNLFSSVSLLCVAQADIAEMGVCNFYSKEEIKNTMVVTYSDDAGEKSRLPLMETIDPTLELMLSMLTPVFAGAMGNLGSNLHFYVLDDISQSSRRVLDPYLEGFITVTLSKRNGDQMNAVLETPLNSLYIPRKCPNGKDAHVSWKYCPWTGVKLED
jgi:hypothetical protein